MVFLIENILSLEQQPNPPVSQPLPPVTNEVNQKPESVEEESESESGEIEYEDDEEEEITCEAGDDFKPSVYCEKVILVININLVINCDFLSL